ncbi:MAG: ATP-binding cassette domain-containing protein [Micromonosporaceae bacterium]|nr:ATP-binding cassette domain-containing protein [Micromonosporaceae bacterium]
MIELRQVSHSFGSGWVLRDVSLQVGSGQIVAVVGASGCGKSTVLNFISGLLHPTEGEVRVHGRPVTGLQPHKIGYMFARDGLLPWRTAQANVELGLELQHKPDRRRTALRFLEMVGLADAGGKHRSELSQGMRQRVALARTLAPDPDVLLMDEPFAALDAQTRLALSSRFLTLCQARPYTVVWVTHDLAEAVSLSDEVVVLGDQPARVVARHRVPFGRPRDLVPLSTQPEFQRLVSRLWDDIGTPVLS